MNIITFYALFFFRKKVKEQREKVIAELLHTEREYCRDLRLTCEIFNLHEPQNLERQGVDCATLFGNILEVNTAFGGFKKKCSFTVIVMHFVGNQTVGSVYRPIESVQHQQRRCKRAFHRQGLYSSRARISPSLFDLLY